MTLDEILKVLLTPTSIVSFIALIIVIVSLIKVKNIKLTTRTITLIGIMLALSTVLSFIKFMNLPFGGSTTLGSMVPIIVLALIYGPEVGFLAGFIFGIINLSVDPYILYPIQALFDYPLAYMCLGLAGFFRNKKILAPIVAIGGRFIFHYLSGIIFFASTVPEGQSPYLYSLTYNASYLVPELIIALIIIALLPLDQLKRFVNR